MDSSVCTDKGCDIPQETNTIGEALCRPPSLVETRGKNGRCCAVWGIYLKNGQDRNKASNVEDQDENFEFWEQSWDHNIDENCNYNN